MLTNQSLSKTQSAVLVALRMALGWHLLYEGVDKLLDPGWSARTYLSTSEWLFSSLFHWIANTAGVLKVVDLLNEWALVVIGLGLITGIFTRAMAAGGAGLLLLYYVAHPPFDAVSAVMPGSFLIVDRNLVEVIALIAFAVMPAKSLWGLDRLWRVRQVSPQSKPESPSDRRELLADLVSVPVLGTFVVALLSGKKIKGKLERAADVSRDRDVFIASASRPAGYSVPATTNLVNLHDFEKAAQVKMSPASWEFVDSGAGDDQTARWNADAYHRIYLQMRANVDVSKIDTRIRLFGREHAHPIMLSPISNHNYVHPEAERATARGAGAARATLIVSTFAGDSIETIAKAATMPLWHSTYLMKDHEKTRDMLQRVAAAGYEAVCVPIDTPVIGARDREHRTYRFKTKPVSFQTYPVNYYRYPTTWADIEWYLSQTKLPLLLKGIMNPEDAERAIRMGVAGIFVSNHGGRNLDTVPATIDALPRIVEKVAGRVPVIIDGGIRRGTDVLKALAYGATAVSIGRPYIYGLATKGPEGVTGIINILRNELEMAMANTGRPTIASIDRTVIASRG